MIWVAVWLTTLQGSAPTVTTLLPLPDAVSSSITCSKPLPLTVSSVPPPAEPALGEIPVIATT